MNPTRTVWLCRSCGMPSTTHHYRANLHPSRPPRGGAEEVELVGTLAETVQRYRDEHGWVTHPEGSYARQIASLS